MISLRIWVMMVVMPVVMTVAVAVIMMMMPVVMMMIMGHVQPAFACAKCRAKIAIFDITAGGGNTFAFNMVVVAFLGQANFIFKAQHLRPVFTHRTIHIVIAGQDFAYPISKSRDHLIMVIEITCFDKFNIRMAGGNFIGETVNPIN